MKGGGALPFAEGGCIARAAGAARRWYAPVDDTTSTRLPGITLNHGLIQRRHSPDLYYHFAVLPMLHMGGVPREQKTLKGHLPRVIHHREYFSIRR